MPLSATRIFPTILPCLCISLHISLTCLYYLHVTLTYPVKPNVTRDLHPDTSLLAPITVNDHKSWGKELTCRCLSNEGLNRGRRNPTSCGLWCSWEGAESPSSPRAAIPGGDASINQAEMFPSAGVKEIPACPGLAVLSNDGTGNRLPTQVVVSPSLELFKRHGDVALVDMAQW